MSDVNGYITGASKGEIPHEEELLTAADAYNEYVMTALRTVDGIDKSLVAPEYGEHLSRSVQRFVDEGLVAETMTHYRPTPKGLLQADGIAASLFV